VPLTDRDLHALRELFGRLWTEDRKPTATELATAEAIIQKVRRFRHHAELGRVQLQNAQDKASAREPNHAAMVGTYEAYIPSALRSFERALGEESDDDS